MINGKEDKNLVVALDVGTSKIVVIVAETIVATEASQAVLI